MSRTDTSTVAGTERRPAWGHWPSLVGLAVAISQIVTGVDAEGAAITVTIAASCYLAAAALGQRWIAWAGIVVGAAVVTVSELAGIPWWAGLAGYAAVLVAVGLGRPAPCRILSDQSLGMVVFGGLAVVAMFISPRVGLGLAGLALASHALWDYRHWRRNDVVPRSVTEFCMMLDVPVGGVAVVLAITG